MSRWILATIVLTWAAVFPGGAVAEPEAEETPRREDAAATEVAAHADAQYARHVALLRARLPDEGQAFTIVVQKPFVVVGDESAARVRQHAVRTVKWAVDRLKADYFKKDPDHIIDVFLFRDAASYQRHAKILFDEEPFSPFGYYSAVHKALVMNIATGGGTLVHEIVHPFMRANFPACPAWFNEGMGSLYEQCGDEDGRIYGYPNWRLPGLQAAIKAGELQTFKHLCSTTDRQFYTSGRKTNYAQARYLCYFLQEEGLLRDYYRAFTANQKRDATGYETLVKILEEEDMTAFEKRWAAFVMKLRFD